MAKKWINVSDSLPKETSGYLVTKRTVKTHGTFATFVHLTGKWMANINGVIWEIAGVQYWREKPKQPGGKNEKV